LRSTEYSVFGTETPKQALTQAGEKIVAKFLDLKSQISSTKLQMVRQAHQPESSRRVNPNIQNPMTKIFTKVVSYFNPIPNLLAMMLLCPTLDGHLFGILKLGH
jgi:hypothetical protein